MISMIRCVADGVITDYPVVFVPVDGSTARARCDLDCGLEAPIGILAEGPLAVDLSRYEPGDKITVEGPIVWMNNLDISKPTCVIRAEHIYAKRSGPVPPPAGSSEVS